MKYKVTEQFLAKAYNTGLKAAVKIEKNRTITYRRCSPASKVGIRVLVEWVLANQSKLKKTKP